MTKTGMIVTSGKQVRLLESISRGRIYSLRVHSISKLHKIDNNSRSLKLRFRDISSSGACRENGRNSATEAQAGTA